VRELDENGGESRRRLWIKTPYVSISDVEVVCTDEFTVKENYYLTSTYYSEVAMV